MTTPYGALAAKDSYEPANSNSPVLAALGDGRLAQRKDIVHDVKVIEGKARKPMTDEEQLDWMYAATEVNVQRDEDQAKADHAAYDRLVNSKKQPNPDEVEGTWVPKHGVADPYTDWLRRPDLLDPALDPQRELVKG